MKFLNVIIKYRLLLGAFFLLLAIVVNIETSFWPSFILYLIACGFNSWSFSFWPHAVNTGLYGKWRYGRSAKSY